MNPARKKTGSKPKNSNPISTSNSNSGVLNSEAQQQFETELCWCIHELQRALNSGKLNERQSQDNTKVLNSLMNNATPFVKKRQLMRTHFGDYRAKMVKEGEKCDSKAKIIKIQAISPNKKSLFVKKSSVLSTSGNTFKFDFKVDESDLKETIADGAKHTANEFATKNVGFTASDNSFRFSFKCDDS